MRFECLTILCSMPLIAVNQQELQQCRGFLWTVYQQSSDRDNPESPNFLKVFPKKTEREERDRATQLFENFVSACNEITLLQEVIRDASKEDRIEARLAFVQAMSRREGAYKAACDFLEKYTQKGPHDAALLHRQ